MSLKKDLQKRHSPLSLITNIGKKTYSNFNMNPFIIISTSTGRDKEAHIVKFLRQTK